MNDITSKREAQQRVDRIRAFRQELARLERENVLTLSSEQRQGLEASLDQELEALAQRFDVDVTESQKQISWGMRIASTIGGLALCAAVFLFFYRFWGLLETPVQVAILMATPISAVLAAEYAARRERTLYFAALLCLVAIASFIMNLSVLASIFNITPAPGGFLVWGAFALILAYHYRLRLPLVAGLVCLGTYVAAELTVFAGVFWPQFPEGSETLIPAGLLMLAVPLAVKHRQFPEFPAVYRLAGLLVVFLALLMLSLKMGRSYLLADAAVFYQVTGLVAGALAIWLGIRHRLPAMVNLGATFFVIFLYCRFVAWWWDWMPKYLFFLIIGLISVGLLSLFKRFRRTV